MAEVISLVIDGQEEDLSWIELAERLNRTGHVTAASENWLVVRAVQVMKLTFRQTDRQALGTCSRQANKQTDK